MTGKLLKEDRLDRLRQENEALNDQVRLLVQTEQRLYRTQNALDRQLSRIQSLSDCALRCASLEEPAEILEQAVHVLLTSFDLDRAVAGSIDPDHGTMRLMHALPDGERWNVDHTAEAGIVEWLRGRPAACICEGGGPCFNRLKEIVEIIPGPDAATAVPQKDGLVICITVRRADGELNGFVVALKRSRAEAWYYKELPEDLHVPFLQLLANHMERALQNARLTRALRDRGEELVESNRRLQSSLENLESTQGQLLQAQKMDAVGRLAGGIAHDFNNILTVILGHAQLLKDRFPESSAEWEDLRNILDAGSRAATITSHLLAFGRKQPHTPEVVDLNELTERMGRMLRRIIGAHISFQRQADLGIGRVRVDRSQLEQIILNLVLNARDAMPDGGALTIETRRAVPEDTRDIKEATDPGAYVALEISDTGEGMDEATRQQIFEPFFTTKEVGQGTGLGLAMVYGLVKQNHGHIAVRSELGRGSSLVVLLPHVATPRPGRAHVAVRRVAAKEEVATILVAEDEESIRELACRILRDAGFHVLVARDGQEALETARQHEGTVDLLLSDVVMPRVGGVELARRLREERPELRVLFMTGYSFDALGDPGGPTAGCMQKPFLPKDLLERVRRALQR